MCVCTCGPPNNGFSSFLYFFVIISLNLYKSYRKYNSLKSLFFKTLLYHCVPPLVTCPSRFYSFSFIPVSLIRMDLFILFFYLCLNFFSIIYTVVLSIYIVSSINTVILSIFFHTYDFVYFLSTKSSFNLSLTIYYLLFLLSFILINCKGCLSCLLCFVSLYMKLYCKDFTSFCLET